MLKGDRLMVALTRPVEYWRVCPRCASREDVGPFLVYSIGRGIRTKCKSCRRMVLGIICPDGVIPVVDERIERCQRGDANTVGIPDMWLGRVAHTIATVFGKGG
jgi:hypothetical protein